MGMRVGRRVCIVVCILVAIAIAVVAVDARAGDKILRILSDLAFPVS